MLDICSSGRAVGFAKNIENTSRMRPRHNRGINISFIIQFYISLCRLHLCYLKQDKLINNIIYRQFIKK